MAEIIWSRAAITDLKSIEQFIARDSGFYARKTIERILERVHILKEIPESGRMVPEFEIKNIRELIEGNYRIVYRLRNAKVEIVRVHHSARLIRR